MSHITVDACRVELAANKIIGDILAERKRRDEKKISEVMSKTRYRLMFLKVMPFTREEAIKALKADFSFSFPSPYAWGDLSRAEALLCLAQNGDPVTVSAQDALLLWGNK